MNTVLWEEGGCRMEELEQNEQLLEQRRLRRLEQKRRRKMQQRMVLGLLALIVVLALVLIVRGCRAKPATAPVEPSVPEEPVTTPTEPEADSVVQLTAVGDIMIYDDILAAAQKSEGVYDFSDCFSAVAAYTMGADLTVGNLELNFCGAPYAGKPDFRAPEALAGTLRDIGFDVLQTANTYSIQNGMTGLSGTISALDAVDIDHVGTYATQAERDASGGVLVKTVNGVRIAFIAFTKGVNNLTLPEGSEFAVDLLYTDYDTDYSKVAEDAIVQTVKNAVATDADIVIAMLHWGSEYDNTLTDTQKKIESLLLENGVDVILGSHSHVVGNMLEKTVQRGNDEANCFVAYSLGNFFSSQTQSGTTESVLLNLEITKSGKTGQTSITNINYIPLYLLRQEGENGAAQVQVLPIRSAITSGLFDEQAQTLTDAIADLRANTASDYDAGK